MIALLSLILAFLLGRLIVQRLVGRPDDLLGIFGLSASTSAVLTSWFASAAALIVGIQVTTVTLYSFTVLFQEILPFSVYPLLPANSLIGLLIAFLLMMDWHRNPEARPAILRPERMDHTGLWKQQRFFWFSLLCFILFSSWLAFYSFSRSGTVVSAGASVFGDFAPHTALVSSFAKGRNFPAGYPHFAGDGIAYHFLFYFLCGNLNYLGLPVDLAINLPSILVFVAFCVLLGTLAVSITRYRAAFFLAPLLMFFRSSFAFLTRLRDLWLQPGARLSTVIDQILNAQVFIGDTPRDDWGLWGLNVYANQRHLLLGFGAIIVVLFLFFPFLKPSGQPSLDSSFSDPLPAPFDSRLAWLPRADERGRLMAAILIVVLLPYFHGSALVALLVTLCGLALFSRARAAHVLVCVSAVVSALIQGRLFRSGGSFIEPQFYFGFIVENRSATGILAYLIEMSGLVLPLALIAILMIPGRSRLLFAFLLPLVFGLTVSMTPDVTVNHKFLIMTFALCGCLVAGLLIHLWKKPGRACIIRRLLVIVLLIFLTATGVMELFVFRNLNELRIDAQLDSRLAVFVEKNTPPQSVFVTAPLHYHTLLFTGRQIYFGHAYYAWSAGHDTLAREQKERQFLAAPDHDLATAEAFIVSEGVDYLMIDNELRRHPEFSVNEAFFRENYRQVAYFPELGDLLILDLHQMLHAGPPASG